MIASHFTSGKRSFFLFIFIFCIVLSSQAQGNATELGNYFIKNYSRDFLMARGGNWVTHQNKDGLIFVGCTLNGIAIYDGQRIKHVEMKGMPYLNEGRDLEMDSKGVIHVASFYDFGYLNKDQAGKYSYVSLSRSLPDSIKPRSRIWNLSIRNDTVYYQGDSMIYRFKDGKLLKKWRFQKPIHIMHRVGNRIFVRNWGVGLLELVGDEFRLMKGSEFFANNRVDAMYPLKNGDILIASRNVGLWLIKPDGSFVKTNTPRIDQLVMEGEVYLSTTILTNGLIPIITTKYGLVLLDQQLKLVKIINNSVGLANNHLTNIFEDRNHDLWVSHTGTSMISMNPTITYFSTINGLKGGVGEMRRLNGKFYVKTAEELYELVPAKDNFSSVTFKPLGVEELGYDLEVFDDQLITTNNYSVKWTKNGKTQILKTQYYTAHSVQSKLNRSLLFSLNRGVVIHQWNGSSWKEILVKNNKNIIMSYMAEPVPGEMMISSIEGLYQYTYDQTGQGQFYPLKRDTSFVQSNLFTIMKTGPSTYHYIDSSLHAYTADLKKHTLSYAGWALDSLIDNDQVAYAYNENAGYGWIRSMKGLFRIQMGKDGKPQIKKYPFDKVNLAELSNNMYAEGTGENEVIWLSSQDEKLYRYLPVSALKEKSNVYKSLITGAYHGDSLIALENQAIPYEKNALTFEVAYPLFGSEEKTQFSYWLEGQDDTWTSFTPTSKKEYTNLSEGRYTLHVRAMDASGMISEETTLSFRILPPWYRTWWAYVFYLGATGFVVFLFGKWQARRSLAQAENERRINELQAARDFQQSMLPKKVPVRDDLEFSTFLRSSTEVGGDYYDFFEQRNGDLYVVCGDATGHGTISGMMVSITKAGLNGISAIAPNEILRQLNRVIKRVDLGTMRMSLNMLFIADGKVTMSSAAMPPIYRYDAATKTVEEIMISGLPLGGLRKEEFELAERPINTGDVYVLLSDGLPEAPNKQGDLYNYHQVADIIQRNGHLSAKEIQDALVASVDQWLDGMHNPDDITIIVIKKKP